MALMVWISPIKYDIYICNIYNINPYTWYNLPPILGAMDQYFIVLFI